MNPRSIWSHHVMGLSWCYWGLIVHGLFHIELECLERHSPQQHILAFRWHQGPRPTLKIKVRGHPPRQYNCTELSIQ